MQTPKTHRSGSVGFISDPWNQNLHIMNVFQGPLRGSQNPNEVRNPTDQIFGSHANQQASMRNSQRVYKSQVGTPKAMSMRGSTYHQATPGRQRAESFNPQVPKLFNSFNPNDYGGPSNNNISGYHSRRNQSDISYCEQTKQLKDWNELFMDVDEGMEEHGLSKKISISRVVHNTSIDRERLEKPFFSEFQKSLISEIKEAKLSPRISSLKENPNFKQLYFYDGRYEGEITDSKRSGCGIFNFKDGGKYEGEWIDDVREGVGKYVYQNGEWYEGMWKNNVRQGKGIMYYCKDSYFEGEWRNDVRSGLGVMYFSNGDKYQGDWHNDLEHGKGQRFYNNGDKYEGNWKEGNRSGEGVLKYKDGGIYQGKWLLDQRSGYGVRDYINGDRYEGEW